MTRSLLYQASSGTEDFTQGENLINLTLVKLHSQNSQTLLSTCGHIRGGNFLKVTNVQQLELSAAAIS